MSEVTEKKNIKKAFDAEYSTQWLREVAFLKEKGIYWTFVRTDDTFKISTYKYKKTPDLFLALLEFYTLVNCEKKVSAFQPRKRVEEKAEEPEKTEDDTE